MQGNGQRIQPLAAAVPVLGIADACLRGGAEIYEIEKTVLRHFSQVKGHGEGADGKGLRGLLRAGGVGGIALHVKHLVLPVPGAEDAAGDCVVRPGGSIGLLAAFRRKGILPRGDGERGEGEAHFLIPHGVRRDHKRLHHLAFKALRLGGIKICARGKMVDAVALDGDRFAVQVIDRDGRDRFVADKAKRKRLPAAFRKGGGEKRYDENQREKQGKGAAEGFMAVHTRCLLNR